jgi:hypothetical protein
MFVVKLLEGGRNFEAKYAIALRNLSCCQSVVKILCERH